MSTSSSVAVENGSTSGSSSDGPNNNTVANSMLSRHFGSPNHCPRRPWIQTVWAGTQNRYERIATGSPRATIGLLSQSLVRHHLNFTPTLHSVSDFLAFFNDEGRHMGSRPKLATWPLTKRDEDKNRVWSA